MRGVDAFPLQPPLSTRSSHTSIYRVRSSIGYVHQLLDVRNQFSARIDSYHTKNHHQYNQSRGNNSINTADARRIVILHMTQDQQQSTTTQKQPQRRKKRGQKNWTDSLTTITGQWREMYTLLQTYYYYYHHYGGVGNSNISQLQKENIPPIPPPPENGIAGLDKNECARLSRWIARQRTLYQQQFLQDNNIDDHEKQRKIPPSQRLTQERIDALTSIDVNFFDPSTSFIPKRIKVTIALPPSYYNTDHDVNSSSRTRPMTRRRRTKKQRHVNTTKRRQRRISWNERFHQLCQYRAIHGHARVPCTTTTTTTTTTGKDGSTEEAFPGLGIWVRNQIAQYRNLVNIHDNDEEDDYNDGDTTKRKKVKKIYLTPERIMALQSIGLLQTSNTSSSFSSSSSSSSSSAASVQIMPTSALQYHQREERWKYRFDELVEFQSVYGHCLVPENYHENPELGVWVRNLRSSYKRSFLSGESALGKSLQCDDDDDDDVGRKNKIRSNGGALGGLTREKMEALEKIGFCWTQPDLQWYSMFERLKAYVEKRKIQWNGGQQQEKELTTSSSTTQVETRPEWFHIPIDDTQNRDLRLWVSVQRRSYSNLQRQRLHHENNKDGNNHDTTTTGTGTTIMSQRRVDALNSIYFPWSGLTSFKSSKRGGYGHNGDDSGPSTEDWSQLFVKMREKGIDSSMRPKEHWFEGQSLVGDSDTNDEGNGKDGVMTDDDLLELWNMEDEDDDY